MENNWVFQKIVPLLFGAFRAVVFLAMKHLLKRSNASKLPCVTVSPVSMGLLTMEHAKDATPSEIWGN